MDHSFTGKITRISTSARALPTAHAAVFALASCLPYFSVEAAAATVWDQSDVSSSVTSVNASSFLPVNDFALAEPTALTGFSVWLSNASPVRTEIGGGLVADVGFGSFSGTLSYYVFEDNGNVPGNLLAAGSAQDVTVTETGIVIDANDAALDVFRVDGQFSAPIALAADDFWFGIRKGMVGAPSDGSDILWRRASASVGAFAALYVDGQNIDELNFAPSIDNAFVLRATNVP